MDLFENHSSARLRIPTFIDFLMELVPTEERGLVLAELDANGLTPLHCAVIGIESCESNDKEAYLDIVERLLGYGADSNLQSTKGVTPLGSYRLAVSGRFDYMRVFGMRRGDDLGEWRVFHRKMEAALKPSGGETPDDAEAKCALLDNDDEDDSEEDAFMDDNSDDEEGNDGEDEDDDHVDNEE
jgi:ankyrin repeat protein